MSSRSDPSTGTVRAFDNQHVVSQAILRRWIDGEPKLLEVYDRGLGSVVLARTDEVCAIQNFIHANAERAEKKWSDYERHLGNFYRALIDEALFDNSRALQTARAMLALHAARSHTMCEVSLRAQALARERIAHDLVAKCPDQLIAEIHEQARLFVPITYAVLLDQARRAVHRNAGALALGGEVFRDRLFAHFGRAKQLMAAQRGIEVFVPANPESEFVIGDDPVLIPSGQRDGRFGPRHGVGWLEAQTFVMPFSPRHVIAVGPANVWREVNDDLVRWINRHQVRQSRRHLVTRRGSGMAQWAADVIKATAEEAA